MLEMVLVSPPQSPIWQPDGECHRAQLLFYDTMYPLGCALKIDCPHGISCIEDTVSRTAIMTFLIKFVDKDCYCRTGEYVAGVFGPPGGQCMSHDFWSRMG